MELERKQNGRFKGNKYQPKANPHKTAYIMVNKATFEVVGSCFKRDLYEFLQISENTFNKYLKKGEFKGWIIKKVDDFRVKRL